jgi:hypothetical protein
VGHQYDVTVHVRPAPIACCAASRLYVEMTAHGQCSLAVAPAPPSRRWLRMDDDCHQRRSAHRTLHTHSHAKVVQGDTILTASALRNGHGASCIPPKSASTDHTGPCHILFFSANARSSGFSLRRGKMIQFIGKSDRKTIQHETPTT